MEEQLLQAVQIASSPAGQNPNIVQDALTFLEQVKLNSQEVWSPAWNIFAARSKETQKSLHSHQQRLFGLSLVTDFLENKISTQNDPSQAIAFLQSAALKHFDEEYIGGSGEDGAVYVKNKFAQFLSGLLVQAYGLPPPFTLLPDLVGRMRTHNASSSSALNPTSTDMVLRLLHEISVNLGSDATLRAVRSRERVARDTAIRDEIRSSQATGIADAVWKVIEESFAKTQELASAPTSSTDGQGWNMTKSVEITCGACEVIGDYASWIDISLVVTPDTVNLLSRLLQDNNPNIRSAASDALNGIVSKGMKSPDKMTLLRILNLTTMVGDLERKTRKPEGVSELPDEEVIFREHLAKLANAVAVEIAKVVEDNSAPSDLRSEADEMLLSHMHLVLDFLTDEYDEMADHVMSCISVVLTIYKRLQRQSTIAQAQATGLPATQGTLTPEKSNLLSRLMGIILIKMKFDEDSEWKGTHDEEEDEDDDDETAKFLQLRKQLQQHAASIAGIDESLFSAPTISLIYETLNACDAFLNNTGPEVSWQRAELALFAVYFVGEILTTSTLQPKAAVGPMSFVSVPANTPKSVRNKPPEGFLLSLTLNQLGEVTQRFYESKISAYRHSAVQMQYFDCSVRYAAFFSVRPEMLADALTPFLDWRGIHNDSKSVRCRTDYLFLRFVKETREHIQSTYVQGILESMRSVLVVSAKIAPVGQGEDPFEEALKKSAVFDRQLDLFEACGVLLQLLRQTPDTQMAMLKALIDPLSNQFRQAVEARLTDENNLEAVLQIHHLFFALANLAKGFPDISPSSSAQTLPWMGLFKEIIEQMLTTLQTGSLSSFKVIRDAARGAFSRMVSTTGFIALPYVPSLLQILLPRLSENELLDFYSFLGLITAKYKIDLASVMDEMLDSLLDRTFYFLNQDVSGTDDVVIREQLIKGYVTFLSTLIGAGLDEVLRSDRNQSKLETVLQSLVFYATNSPPATVRNIANVMTRLVTLWLEKITPNGSMGSPTLPSTNGNGNAANAQITTPRLPLPGFEQFVYSTFVGLIFEIPSKPSFDFNDAQSQIALAELCSLSKAIYQKRGQEFVDMLLTAYFPSINCPSELANEFVLALQKQETREFKKSLERFILRSRSSTNVV